MPPDCSCPPAEILYPVVQNATENPAVDLSIFTFAHHQLYLYKTSYRSKSGLPRNRVYLTTIYKNLINILP